MGHYRSPVGRCFAKAVYVNATHNKYIGIQTDCSDSDYTDYQYDDPECKTGKQVRTTHTSCCSAHDEYCTWWSWVTGGGVATRFDKNGGGACSYKFAFDTCSKQEAVGEITDAASAFAVPWLIFVLPFFSIHM